MRKIIYGWTIIVCSFLFSLFTACENDLPVYDNQEGGLMFVYERRSDTLTNYSFAYDVIDIDTVWVKARILGFPADRDRAIMLKQLVTGQNDAVSGEHFVPFNDPELMEKFYYIPKGKIEQDLPIVLKRAASLKEANYTLRVSFETNAEFTFGNKDRIYKRIVLADQLIKPNKWDSYCKYFLGDYGPVKHQFLIQTTGFKWDEDFVNKNWYDYYTKDQNFCFYMAGAMNDALSEYEAVHGKLYEEGNRPVSFPKFN